MIARRGILGMIGMATAAPVAAQAAQATKWSPLEYGQSAAPSLLESEHKKHSDFSDKNSRRFRIRAARQQQHFDGDIGSMRSWSMATKQRVQFERDEKGRDTMIEFGKKLFGEDWELPFI